MVQDSDLILFPSQHNNLYPIAATCVAKSQPKIPSTANDNNAVVVTFGYTCSIIEGKKGSLRGQDMAVKDIPVSKFTTTFAIKDVRRKVKVLHALTGNKNVVQFYEAYENEYNVYVVLELCNGRELRQLLGDRKYAEEDAKLVMVQILNLVAYCCLHVVVHRDLKPKNCLFISNDEHSSLKAIDFGFFASWFPP